MRVVDMIRFWARAKPDSAAIIQPETVTTYHGLACAIETIADRIDRLKLDKREPVAVSLANPSFMIATTFALLRSGFSAALVSPSVYPHLQREGIRNLIYDTQGQVLSGGRNIRFDVSWLPTTKSPGNKWSDSERQIEKVDTIFFTSGSTGLPKKIVQSGRALEQLLQYSFNCATGTHQKVLIMPGLSSTFGFNRVCEVFNVGKSACFAPFGEPTLSMIGVFRVDFIIASVSQALALADVVGKHPSYQLDSLKAIQIGGGKIGLDGVKRIRAALCKNVLSHYASTEAGFTAWAPFDLIEDIPGAVGFVLPWTELEIVNETGQILPTGAEGLIRCRTPQFLENTKAMNSGTSVDTQDSWFYPGDIGSVNAQGILCLAGRNSDVINRGGQKVSGTRIEEVLEALPAIKEAAACGVVGQSGLEEIWIAVVAQGPVDIAEIKRCLKEHNDIGAAPDEIFVLDHLPRGELGKIQKGRLRELLISRKAGV